MFYNRPDCIKLAEGIYVFKKYVPDEMCDKFVKQLESFPIEQFIEDDTNVGWYTDKMSPDLDNIIELWEHVSELIYPEYVINPQNKVIATRPGQSGMFVHVDSPGKGKHDELIQVDTFSTCALIDYGVVAYLGQFEGGEVFYSSFNPDGTSKQLINLPGELEYKPEQGDVVIHGSEAPYFHGTRDVKSGVRYAFSCFATRASENPGSFYNYKTPEYLEQIGDKSPERVAAWLTPLFSNNREFNKKVD
jgi:hypothetical protein